MRQKKFTGGELVVQHNHMVNARFNMTANEMRLFVFMLSEIERTDTQFKMIEIPVELFRNSRGNILYQDIKAAADRITQRRFAIQNINGGRNFQFIPLMSICAYQEGEGFIKARFNDEVKPYLLQLGGNFTASQIKQLLRLKSYYAHRMYWLLKQYQDFGTRTIELKELREILELTSKYKRYLDFRIRVLDRAQEELAKTDMAFSYEEIRKGRSVRSIKFMLENNSKKQVEHQDEEHVMQAISEEGDLTTRTRIPVRELLRKYLLSERQIQNIVTKVSEKDIYKVNYDLQCEKDHIKNANIAGYTYSVFKKRFNL